MTEVQTAPWVSNSSCEIRKCGRCLSLWTDVRAERVFLKPVVFLPLILIDHVCGCVIFSVCIDCEWRQAWVMALRLYAAHACVFTNTHKQHVSPGVCQQHSVSSGFNTSLLACVLARVILCVSACGVVWGDEPSPLTTLHKNTFCSPWTLQMPPHCSSLLAAASLTSPTRACSGEGEPSHSPRGSWKTKHFLFLLSPFIQTKQVHVHTPD